MQKKVENYATEHLQQDFQPNLTLLNEVTCVTAIVISSITLIHEQNSFKQSK